MARTKALMGERQEALGVFRGASLDYLRFRDVLTGYPGFHALDHAFNVTMAALDTEQTPAPSPSDQVAAARSNRTRKRVSRAA